MAGVQDVMNSLGFRALQARQAYEAQKNQEAAQQQMQQREESAQGFDRMTQLLGILDKRREANRQHELALAQQAGEVGLTPAEGADEETQGSFQLGAAVGDAEKKKAVDAAAMKQMLEQLKRTSVEHEGQLNREALDARSRAQIEATNGRQVATADAAMDREDARFTHAKDLLAIKDKQKKSGKKANTNDVTWHPDWPSKAKNDMSAQLIGLRETRDQAAKINSTVTNEELQGIADYANTADSKITSFLDKLSTGTIGEEEANALAKWTKGNQRLASMFNIVALARGGKALTENEIKRIGLEFPRPGDSATAIRAKLENIIKIFDERDANIVDMAKKGPFNNTPSDARSPETKNAELSKQLQTLQQQMQELQNTATSD